MAEKRRCHRAYIWELFFKRIAVIIAMALTASISMAGSMAGDRAIVRDMRGLPWGKMLLLCFAVLLVFGGATLLYCAFQWRHTYLSLHEDALDYETGHFLKKRVTIPFERINTIDLSRSMFEKLAGTCRLKIDTGAYSNTQDKNQPEVNLVFDLKEAYNIRRYILSRSEQYSHRQPYDNSRAIGAPKWAIHAGIGDFILYGLTSSSVWKLIWLLAIGVCVAAEISAAFVGRAMHAALPFLRDLLEKVEQLGAWKALLSIAAGYLIASLASDIVTILWAAVRFFDFRVARQGRNILIRYGLFNEKNYTLQVRNIHAVIVRQNLFQQLVGRCSVEAVCMGLGDEQTETALLFPIIRKKELNANLRMVLPEYTTDMHTQERRSAGLLFHAVMPAMLCAAACAVVYRIGGHWIEHTLLLMLCCMIAVVLVLMGGVMSYFNTTLDWNQKIVSVQSGGFHKRLYRIRTDAVQEVQMKTDPVREMFGIVTYYVHYHGPRFNNTSVAGNISSAYFRELAEIVEN